LIIVRVCTIVQGEEGRIGDMALFRRKKNQEVMPDEVRDYYEAEQRDRMGMTWLLAIGAFLLTAALVVGLFFAGRWVYQRFFDDSADTTGTAVVENGLTEEPEAGQAGQDETDDDAADPSASNEDEDEDEAAAPATPSTPTTNGQVGSGATTTPTQPSAPATTPRETETVARADSSTATTTPTTGPADDLPETGPANLLGLFTATTLLGAAAHRAVTSRFRR
jgi:cytoskeletal protein RodZ